MPTPQKNMRKATNKERCLSYLTMYANKDLDGVTALFADGIILRDWKIRVVGKQKAVEETKKNFEAAQSLTIDVLSTYENTDTVAAELKIVVNKVEALYVVDVITFNEDGLITSIRAYLGRGDDGY
ncbi:MAG: nuclear transport factor 2 family protein [Bacteroidota bacterium]